MPIDINTFNRDPYVQRFINYLEAVILAQEPIAHGYRDRYLLRRRSDLRNGLNPQRHFETLEDAFSGYYWPTPKGSYAVNQKILTALRADIKAAWATESEADLRTAIEAVLWWGAGNRRSRLYTANMSWLDAQVDRATMIELLRTADNAFSAAPVFDENAFDAASLRSNAGFTKVYALLFDDFIIYDSRVAAALGILVARFLDAQHPPVNQIPDHLNFARMGASGGDNRDASTRDLRFRFAWSHACHAQSNWIANRVIEQVVCRLFEKSIAPPWIGPHSDALRRIEAALFMLGKHIPLIGDQEPTANSRIPVRALIN